MKTTGSSKNEVNQKSLALLSSKLDIKPLSRLELNQLKGGEGDDEEKSPIKLG